MEKFKKFIDFVNEKNLEESALNKAAMEYDRKVKEFSSRFQDHKEGENIVKSAGYKDVHHFLSDPDTKKWSKLKIPGQKNYVK
jgi:hypothetical protein